MEGKKRLKTLTVILTIVLIPLIIVYCLLWAALGLGGGIVGKIFKKKPEDLENSDDPNEF